MATTNDPAAKSGPRHPLTSLHELYETLLALPSAAISMPEDIANDFRGPLSNGTWWALQTQFGGLEEIQGLPFGVSEGVAAGAEK